MVIELAEVIAPNARVPRGTVPPKPMNHSAMTRPRTALLTCCWSTVSSEVMTTKYA